jgi:hypothetical protein
MFINNLHNQRQISTKKTFGRDCILIKGHIIFVCIRPFIKMQSDYPLRYGGLLLSL